MKNLKLVNTFKNIILGKLSSTNFVTKQQASIGLDIGTSCIKLVALESKGKDKTLKKLSSSVITSRVDVGGALDSFVKSEGLYKHTVNVSISGPSVTLRYVVFPRMNAEELKSTMQYEAKEFIPFPLEEVMLDSIILKEKVSENKMLVLLAAVKKIEVQERIAILEKAGLIPGLIDVDCLCLANAFQAGYVLPEASGKVVKSETIGFLNIGYRFTNMAIIEDGAIKFSRDITLGGSDITKKIADVQQIDYSQAELIKIDPQKIQEVLPLVEAVINSLCLEVRQSIDYYENQSGRSVDKIFLTGGSSYLLNITKFFNNIFDIPVDIYDVFFGVNCDAMLETDKQKLKNNHFAVAYGLALRG